VFDDGFNGACKVVVNIVQDAGVPVLVLLPANTFCFGCLTCSQASQNGCCMLTIPIAIVVMPTAVG
jgi:hypothetical protein